MGPDDKDVRAVEPANVQKPEPTKWEKIKAITDIGAVCVSLVAVVVTVIFSYKTAELNSKAQDATNDATAAAQAATNLHNEQSTRPFLDFKYRFGIDSSDAHMNKKGSGGDRDKTAPYEGYLRIANVGAGVAEIVAVDVTFRKDSKSIVEVIDPGAHEMKKLLARELKGNDQIVPSTLKVNQPISPNDFITLLHITPIKSTRLSTCAKDYQRKLFASRLTIKVTYKSNYERCKIAIFDYDTPYTNCGIEVTTEPKPSAPPSGREVPCPK